MFGGCVIEKGVQVDEKEVTLTKVREVYRWGQNKFEMTWITDDSTRYYQFAFYCVDSIGTKKKILLR